MIVYKMCLSVDLHFQYDSEWDSLSNPLSWLQEQKTAVNCLCLQSDQNQTES